MLPALTAVLVGFGVSVVLTPPSGRLARRFGILDHPSPHSAGYKKHAQATPYLGGIAIFVGTLLAVSVTRGFFDFSNQRVLGDFSAGVAIAFVLGLVGLFDDIRPLPRLLRLGAQVGAAYAAWEIGFQVQATGSELFNLALTIFWIVGITNAFNLLDNMDGLSAGLAGVGAASFAVMGLIGDLNILAAVAAAVAGAAFGFLVHNRHPAKVFMGDAGSIFLGFLLALIGIELRFDNLTEVTFLVPVVALGLPIFDTTIVVLSRIRHRRPIFLGGRDHVSHRLVKMGLPVTFSVGLLYWAGICLGWLGLVVSRANTEVGWMLLGLVFALGAFFGFLLWRIPIYEGEPEIVPHTHQEAEALDQIPPTPESVAR